MKPVWKCASRFATAILAVSFAVTLAPAWGADDMPSSQPAAQPASSPAATTDTQQRLAELEKEISVLQQEIAALKDDNTPGLKTAAYVMPGGAPASAPAPDDAQKVTLASLLGSTTFSGFVDGYYGFNANHPFNNMNGLRAFDAATNAFSLNNVELIVDHPPDATSNESRLGFHVALGYGQAALAVNTSDVFTDYSNFYVKEAYGSYLAPVGKGLKIDVGRFVTPFGAEVIETNANWNYSRSILFYYAIPYMHFGARAAYTFNKQWALTGYLVNGWNNSLIMHAPNVVNIGTIGQSSGLTYGASLAWTPNAKWSVTENYMAGPVIDAYAYNAKENEYTISDWKQLADTVIAYTPNSKWAFQVNGDYGFGPHICPDACLTKTVQWWGSAGYAKYNFNSKSNFAVRYEYYGDPNGYTLFGFGPHNPHAQEVTGTYSYNLTSGLLVRTEYRYDFTSSPFFEQGSSPTLVKEQHTATLGIVYSFSSPTK